MPVADRPVVPLAPPEPVAPPPPADAPTPVSEAAAAPVITPPQGPPEQYPARPVVVQNAAVGLATTVATNTMSGGFSGNWEVNAMAGGLNALIQWLKEYSWFNEKRWTIPTMLAVGVLVLCWYYRDPAHWDLISLIPFTPHFLEPGYMDLPGKGLLQGIQSAFQSLANYHGLAMTGASPLKPTSYPQTWEAAHPPAS